MRSKVILALLLLFGLQVAHPQANSLASPYSNSVFTPQIFTASGQTGKIIQLNGLVSPSSTVGSSFASGTITITGTSLTTVTFSLLVSADNGVTYNAWPISVAASPSTPPATSITATGNGLYQVSLAGITHVKFVTSGTFTATAVSITLTGSPNALTARSGSSGGGATTPATNRVYKGTGLVNGVTDAIPGTDYVIPSGNVATADLATDSNAVGGVALSGLCQSGGTNCPPSGGSSAGTPNDVQSAGVSTGSFAADPGNFTYTAGTSHTLGTINQAMSGFFNQVVTNLAVPTSQNVENHASGPTSANGDGQSGAARFYARNWGVGKNNGNPGGFTTAAGWRVMVGLELDTDARAAGIHQGLHIQNLTNGSGDSAAIYVGNSQGFSPCLWVDASGEGCIIINGNGTQYACIANGTITSTTGTGDTAPVFNIDPVNCNGGQELINDGVIIDTSVTIVHTAMTGTQSTLWESNPLGIGSLAVTAASVTPSTGMCITTADIPLSSVPGTYQTQTLACPVHDSLAITAPVKVFVATAGGPEQCTVLTYNSGTGAGTISCAKFHPVGSYIFAQGTQGFADFDDNLSATGLHDVIYVLGAPDNSHVLLAQRENGRFGGGGLPAIGTMKAGNNLSGGVTIRPGALCVNSNATASQCILETNQIAWTAGDNFSSPVGDVTVEGLMTMTSTQSAPDDANSGGFGINLLFGSNTHHSDRHPFFFLQNGSPLSNYLNSGVGSGWLTPPPAIHVNGVMGNAFEFDTILAGNGGTPCGGATLFCYTNPTASTHPINLFLDASFGNNIQIDYTDQLYKFSWGLFSAGNSAFNNVDVFGALTVGSFNPILAAADGNFLFNGVNPSTTAPFLNISQCPTAGCSPTVSGNNGSLSLGGIAGGDFYVGARGGLIINLFPFNHGADTVCYSATSVTVFGETLPSAPLCITNSQTGAPDNFVQVGQTAGAVSMNVYRVAGTSAAPLGLICGGLTPASTVCVDNNNTAGALAPTTGTSGLLTVDGFIFGPDGKVKIAGLGGSVNSTLSFGPNFGNPAIYLYDSTATNPVNSYGFAIHAGELQSFIPTSAHFSWNGDGQFNTPGINELMRLFGTGDLSIGTTSDCGKLIGIGASCNFTVDGSGNVIEHGLTITQAAASGATVPTMVLPIVDSTGTTYYIKLSTTP